MEDIEGVNWFSESKSDLVFFSLFMCKKVELLTKRRKYGEIINAKPFIVLVFLENILA